MAGQDIKVRVAGIFARGDEILLVRHEKEGRSYWLLPGGGLEFGETLAEGLVRELKEEASLTVKCGRLLMLAESVPPDHHRHVLNIVFMGEILAGEAKLGEVSERLKEVAWVKRGKVPSLKFYPDLKAPLLEMWDAGFEAPARTFGNVWKD